MKTPIKTLLAAAMLSSTIASAPAQAASGAPLSRMEVFAVWSSNCGWEYPNRRYTTTCDHGGAQLRVFVLEVVYGFNRKASMMGDDLPRAGIVDTLDVCMFGGQPYDCHGQSIEGFIHEIKLDGYQNGQFVYQNTSVNAPMNTMSTWIIIQ